MKDKLEVDEFAVDTAWKNNSHLSSFFLHI
jgi:hypothetical protein